MKSFVCGLIGLVLTAVLPAVAQTQKPVPIDLTEPIVNAFLASMADIQALAQNYENAIPDTDSHLGGLDSLAIPADIRAKLDATVKPHGFGDYRTWVIVAQNVISTFIYVKVGDVQQQMSGAMAAILNNPNLTPAQKAQIAAQMSQAKASSETTRPSDNNIAVVTPMANKIERMMNSNNDG